MPRLCVGSAKDLLDGDAVGCEVAEAHTRCFTRVRSLARSETSPFQGGQLRQVARRASPRARLSKLMAAVARAIARKSIAPLASNTAVRLAQ